MDKLKNKLAALLRKTELNGASESEAHAAFELAQKLMKEHGITKEDLEKDDSIQFFVKMPIYKNSLVDLVCSVAISEWTGTQVFRIREKKSSKPVFFGYEPDVELANFIYQVCEFAVETEWKIFSGKIPKEYRKKFKFTFQAAMCTRLAERMRSYQSTGTDLMVLKNQLVLSAFEDYKRQFKEAETLPAVIETYNNSIVIEQAELAANKVVLSRVISHKEE